MSEFKKCKNCGHYIILGYCYCRRVDMRKERLKKARALLKKYKFDSYMDDDHVLNYLGLCEAAEKKRKELNISTKDAMDALTEIPDFLKEKNNAEKEKR